MKKGQTVIVHDGKNDFSYFGLIMFNNNEKIQILPLKTGSGMCRTIYKDEIATRLTINSRDGYCNEIFVWS